MARYIDIAGVLHQDNCSYNSVSNGAGMLKTFARQAVASATPITGHAGSSIVPDSIRAVTPGPVSIKASPEERKAGRLSERHLETAVRHVLKDGIAVVENAIDHGVIDALNEKMVQDAIALRNLDDKGPFNYNKGNLQQDAPPVKQYFGPQIFLSEFD